MTDRKALDSGLTAGCVASLVIWIPIVGFLIYKGWLWQAITTFVIIFALLCFISVVTIALIMFKERYL